MEFGFFYDVPIWVLGVMFIVVNLVALELGYRAGVRQRDVWQDAESGGGNLILTSMFALLGLILAFTYAAGVSRHEARKQAVVVEANALGTAFLRAGLAAEPGRTELRQALLDYARTRLIPEGVTLTSAQRRQILQKMLREQSKIWPITERIAGPGQRGPFEMSLVAAVNDVLDTHTMRLAAALDKLPEAVVWMLLFIAAASLMVTGFNAGISGRMSRWRATALAAVLAAVMFTIADFDRPTTGLIKVSETSLNNVIAEMEGSLTR